MNHKQLLETVEQQWVSGPVCVFRMGEHFAVARPNTANCAELEFTKGAELLGTYVRPHEKAKVSTFINRDIGA